MLFGQNSREDYVVLNYLHSQIMMASRSAWGQRDVTLTRTAVARPFRTAFGQEMYETPYEKAAALIDSIVNRVVFKDGNKRTAILAAAVYLNRNGKPLRVSPYESERFMRRVVDEHPPITEIAAWLQNHSAAQNSLRLG